MLKVILVWLAFCLAPIAWADTEIPSGNKTEALIGTGYNTETEKFVGACVSGTEVQTGQPRANIDFSQSLSRDQLAKELGFDAGGKMRYGAADISAAAKFLKASTSNSFSITMVYSGDYRFKNRFLKDPSLSTLGQSVHVDTEKFRQTCGDEFVEQIVEGAKLFFSIRIDFSSREEKDTFESSFSYKSSMAEAHAAIKNMRRNFSQSNSVTVSAFQMGGNVDQITGIFQGTSGTDNQSLGFVQCTLGDFAKCDNVLANALAYATDRTNGFPSQLKKNVNEVNSGPANLFYLTKTYLTAGIYALYPQEVGVAIKAARQELEGIFDNTLIFLTKARYLLYEGRVVLSSRQRAAIVKEEDKLAKNLQKIVATAMTCYNTPMKCIDATSALNPANTGGLSPVDESAFVINPETFRQFCVLAKTVVANPQLKKSVLGMIDAAKEINPNRFLAEGSAVVDECLVSHLVFQESESVSLRGRGISTLSPIAEYGHWKSLDISDNSIVDLSPLAGFQILTHLDASKNQIREVTPITQLQSVGHIDLSFNFIRDAKVLQSVASIQRLDLRDNLPGLECPNLPRAATCLVAPLGLTAQFADIGKALPFSALEPAAAALSGGNQLITGLSDGIPGSFGSAVVFNKVRQEFIPTGNMSFSRRGHSATTIDNDRVLVVGGWGSAIKRLEIFSNKDHSFRLLPEGTHVGHVGHTAIRLADGRVLIVGGYSQGQLWTGQGASYTAELFDPSVEKIVKTVSMMAPRAWQTATPLEDGTILFVGGLVSDKGTATAEIFDPTTETFRWTKGSMAVARGGHTATLLEDGRVLIAGGYVNSQEATDVAELYDPKLQKFSRLHETMKYSRAHHTASRLTSGAVLLTGGRTSILSFDTFSDQCESCLDKVELFDPRELSFRELPVRMPRARSHHLAIPIGMESILFLGGPYWNSASQAEVFSYFIDSGNKFF